MPAKKSITKSSSKNDKFKLTFDSIRAYPMQLKNAWDEILSMDIPDDYKDCQNVVLVGMGGSALGGRIVDSLVSERLRLPFEIFTEYHVPNYVNENTLVISYSYSGTTEETVNATYEALNKNTKVFIISLGGKLKEIAEENNLPHFIIDEKLNPSKQPRMSLGFATGAILALLTRLGFIHVLQEEIDYSVKIMNDILTEYHENSPSEKNVPKQFAEKIERKIPILISSEHLIGVSHAIKNQLNENSKTFALSFDIPELNHHLMEGLISPKSFKNYGTFIFINSHLYSQKVQKRYPITQDIVSRNGYDFLNFSPYSEKKLSQVFEALIFGSMIALYLAEIYKVDITSIPWVDYFKERLSKK